MTVDDPVGNKDHEEEDEASEISVKVAKIFTNINTLILTHFFSDSPSS